MALPKPVMKLFAYLPPSAQQKVMSVGMKAMMNPMLAQRRLALATLPVNFGLVMLPHVIKIALLAKSFVSGDYDNEEPRGKKQQQFLAQDGSLMAFVRRCGAAHNNTLECFPLFAASVLSCCLVETSDPRAAVKLALRYTAGRILYIVAYLAGVNRLIALVRTVAYMDNMLMVLRLFAVAVGADLVAADE